MTMSNTTDGQPLIKLQGITRVYGHGQAAMHALRGVDLNIGEGDFVAVMGPSGSGKSTCLNILGCLDSPSAGSYQFKGIEVSTLSQDQRARLRRHYLGFVFQGFNLLDRTSALENVELPLIYRGTPAAERHARASEALAAVSPNPTCCWQMNPPATWIPPAVGKSWNSCPHSISSRASPSSWSPMRRRWLPTHDAPCSLLTV